MNFDLSKFVQNGRKIVGAGLNYKSVIKERGISAPKEPVLFLKPTSSYITEGQLIENPHNFEVHHEIELGVIIEKKCKNLSPSEVPGVIGGYCLALDLTAVDQMKKARENGLPWTVGKSFDTACPVSKAIPKKAVPCPDNLRLWCSVNSNLRQDMNTSDMLFPCNDLIAFISKYMTLEPYDLILTGSPSGTGPISSGDTLTGGLENILSMKYCVK